MTCPSDIIYDNSILASLYAHWLCEDAIFVKWFCSQENLCIDDNRFIFSNKNTIKFSCNPFHSLQSQINAKFGHMYSSENQRRLEMTAVSENSEQVLTLWKSLSICWTKAKSDSAWAQHMYFQSKAFIQSIYLTVQVTQSLLLMLLYE